MLAGKAFCVYYTISKNACLQGHFYAAVNNTVRAKHERATPKDLLCKDFCVYYITINLICKTKFDKILTFFKLNDTIILIYNMRCYYGQC